MRDKNGHELSSQEVIQKGVKRVVSILSEFQIFLLHIVSSLPSHHIRRFFYRMSGMKIGAGSTIHTGATFYNVDTITIGKDSVIGEGVVLDGRDILTIGDHVAIASEAMLYNAEHAIHSDDFHPETEPVVVEDYVFIGPRAIILPGVTIGKGAVVGAGAVVTKSVSPFTIVGGVPAKEIGQRTQQDLHYKLGRARWFR